MPRIKKITFFSNLCQPVKWLRCQSDVFENYLLRTLSYQDACFVGYLLGLVSGLVVEIILVLLLMKTGML